MGLFIFDTDRKVRTSSAIWLSIIWFLLAATASKWLQGAPRSAADQFDGNPIQRNIFMILLAIGLVVLLKRSKRTVALLRSNLPLLLFFGYCALSCTWSDYPGIAFKRFIKALGDVVMVLVVMTEPQWVTAIKRVLAWAGFLLIPLSVLLIRYYTHLGRAFKAQTGEQVFIGVTNDKNMLGLICLLVGLAAAWRLIHAWREREWASRSCRRPLIAQAGVLAMALWLFAKANSMSSLASFGLALALIFATTLPRVVRKRGMVHLLVGGAIVLASVALFFDFGAGLVQSLGRDPTLTGRTELWNEIIGMSSNAAVGAGFESFWMGPRLAVIWSHHWWHPNEAHNGYLEVYLNLGWIGLAFLALFIITGYRNVLSKLRRDTRIGGLMLAYFTVCIIYSFTEAGFRPLNPIWFFFILASLSVPQSFFPKARLAQPISARSATMSVADWIGEEPANGISMPLVSEASRQIAASSFKTEYR